MAAISGLMTRQQTSLLPAVIGADSAADSAAHKRTDRGTEDSAEMATRMNNLVQVALDFLNPKSSVVRTLISCEGTEMRMQAGATTPVLDTPHFSDIFQSPLPLDEKGLLRPVEVVALPGTQFTILRMFAKHIFQVKSTEYPSESAHYEDRRFLIRSSDGKDREIPKPNPKKILEELESIKECPYVWGGNWREGIPEMLTLYPPTAPMTPYEKTQWTLQGVDCSGLLYQLTNGFTPRNTSGLARFGTALSIAGKDSQEIIKELRPLDLIVWVGHVLIVEKPHVVVESTLQNARSGGVIRRPLLERLEEIMKERAPVNDWDTSTGKRFMIRRWI